MLSTYMLFIINVSMYVKQLYINIIYKEHVYINNVVIIYVNIFLFIHKCYS